MCPIDIQNIAIKNARLLCGNNKYKLFDLYEMIIDDYYTGQYNLIIKQVSDYINKNYVDVKDIAIAIGDKNIFWVSSNE